MTTIVIILLGALVVGGAMWIGPKIFYRERETAQQVHTITTSDGWHISLFRYHNGTPGEPVLLCHGLSGNRFNFVYPHGKSMVDSLTRAGYDCWAIELRGCRSSAPPRDVRRHEACFEDYIKHDIPAAVSHIQTVTGSERLHWIGHSLGGMILYAYEVMHDAQAVASGTTLGTPPGFDGVTTKRYPLILGLVDRFPDLAALGLRLMTPWIGILRLSNTLAPINWSNMLPGVKFYNLMELPPPMVLRQLDHWSTTDTWRLNGDTVDMLSQLRNLQTPLLTIGGASDGLAPPRNLETFHELLPTDDKRLLVLSRNQGAQNNYNHVDLVFSPHGPKEVYPVILQWLEEHALFKANAKAHRQSLEQSQAAIALLDDPVPEKKPKAPKKKTAMKAAAKGKKKTRSGQALWGEALEDAAHVMSEFGEKSNTGATVAKRKKAAVKASKKKKAAAEPKKRKAAKKKVTAKKPAQKPGKAKSGPKKKAKKKSTAKKRPKKEKS